MGFGHRVYKSYDPRAKVLKKSTEDLFKQLKLKSKELEIAKEIEELALNDDYFKEKNFILMLIFIWILLKALRNTNINVYSNICSRKNQLDGSPNGKK